MRGWVRASARCMHAARAARSVAGGSWASYAALLLVLSVPVVLLVGVRPLASASSSAWRRPLVRASRCASVTVPCAALSTCSRWHPWAVLWVLTFRIHAHRPLTVARAIRHSTVQYRYSP